MRHVALILVVFAWACKSHQTPKASAPVEQQPDVVENIAPAPRSPLDELRDSIKDFVTLLADCDKDFFANVRPERLDNWDLPVNVTAMEATCDQLLSRFDRMLEKGAFMSPVADEFFRNCALATDRYVMLAFRCKKVSVRDKAGLKKEIAELRDGLRADVAKIKVQVEQVLGMDDVAMREYARSVDLLPRAADAALSRLRGDMKQWVEQPLKDGKPVWRYSLRTSDVIASRAVSAMRFKGVATAMTEPADALSRAFSAMVSFYAGNYFDAEEKEGPRVRGAVIRAQGPYSLAARKVLKP